MSDCSKNAGRDSLWEATRLSWRGYQFWWKQQPQLLLSIVIRAMTEGGAPYVGIYLSAQLINEIAGGRDPSVLTRLVLTALITAAVLTFMMAALKRWENREKDAVWHVMEQSYVQKLLLMDFQSVEDPHIHDLRSQIWQNSNGGGWGLYNLIKGLDPAVKALTTIVGAVALTVSLFTLPVQETAGQLLLLNHPLFVILLVLIMLAIIFAAPALSNKANGYLAKTADYNKTGNRFFLFFGFMGYNRERALDIRMYRQDVFCRSVIEKTNMYGPKSSFATIIRGPVGCFQAASAAVSQVFIGIAYVFVCLKAWCGAFGVGSVTQYIAAITALAGGVSALLSSLGDLRNNAPFLRTTFAFLDTPNDMYQGSLTIEKRSDQKYEIEFRNVSFRYPSATNYALRDVSLKFSIGERLAIVGMNGSGKTTFIKLLCRLYDPTEGEILLNGIDIRKYDYHEYMSIFSVVFQDFKLLPFGLAENVAASTTVNLSKSEQTLREAGFGDRLDALREGLATNLYKDFDENGVDISGGEAQKIALARALYKDAAFIILDEPTAALDPIAEYEIYNRMQEIVGKKTAVFISHRLSSCRFCHDIAVFHEGRIIQRGSHEELIDDTTNKYHELWNAQAQYYTD